MLCIMLLITVINTAQSVFKGPKRRVAPPKDRAFAVVCRGSLIYTLGIYTVKTLCVRQSDLTLISDIFLAAVCYDLKFCTRLEYLFWIMKKRLIDADAFERYLMSTVSSDDICDDCLQTFLDEMATAAPTVDAEPVVHANWVDRYGDGNLWCSNCQSSRTK